MASGEIRAGKAYVELGLAGDFAKQLDKAAGKLKAFGDSVTGIGKKLAGLGAGIVAPLALAAERFAAMGDELNKASQRTGVGVEQLSKLQYAATQSGASFEDLESGLRKMSKAVFEAGDGSAAAAKSLASIGLTAKELQGLSPDEQFLKIGDALNNVEDSGTKAALAMEIFGKGGATLLPLLSGGAAGIRALQQRAEELGLVIGKDDAEAATKFHDILEDLWKQVNAVTFAVGAAVAKALQPFAEAATKGLKAIIDFAKGHQNLVIAALGVGAALVAAGAAIIGLGVAFTAIGSVISGVSATIAFIGSALGLLLNPVVLVGAGLVALAGYFLVASDTGKQLVSELVSKFNELKDTATQVFSGIADALGAGDILLAGQILWTGLKLLWIQGTQELQNKWIAFKALFVQVAAAAFYGGAELAVRAGVSIEQAFEKCTSSISDLFSAVVANFGDWWDSAVNVFTNSWNKAVQLVTKGVNYLSGLWDSSFDVDAANQAADQLFDKQKSNADNLQAGNKAARDKALTDDSVKRDTELKKNLADLEKAKDDTVAALNKAEADTHGGADKQAEEEKAALVQQKADLEKQLADLRGKAKTEAADTKGKNAPLPTGVDKTSLDDVIANRKSLDLKSAGTFNVNALQSLAGGTVQDRIAAAAEATAAGVKKLVAQPTAKFAA